MDLSEILSNPLFIPLLVAFITIVGNIYFLYRLRKWQYKAEYVISNVRDTYIPLVAEFHDKLEILDHFLENPECLANWRFDKLEKIKKSGLLEFIRSHDKKLYGKLFNFYERTYPQLRDLDELQRQTRTRLHSEWVGYVENALSNEKAKKAAGSFVSELFARGLFIFLLNSKTEEISRIWFDSMQSVSKSYNLYSTIVEAKGEGLIASKSQLSTFNLSQGNLDELLELSRTKLRKLLVFHSQIKTSLEEEIAKGSVPMMQKYIINPLS